MAISPTDFDYIRQLVRQRSAIVLETGKEMLVESRLALLARREGIESTEELLSRLKNQANTRLHIQVVEAMTTNETFFFRDIHPFDSIKHLVIPELIKRRENEKLLHIWCAGCSSGQEPYSLAILIKEQFPALLTWNLKIIAIDLSNEMLTRARNGRYSQFEINRGLPAPLLVRYFAQHGIEWQIRDDIREMVEFSEMNLADQWPHLPPMDVILMRNVLIYFDVETKKAILGKVRQLLRPDGYLFLGAAETTLNLDNSFERILLDKAWCYRPNATS